MIQPLFMDVNVKFGIKRPKKALPSRYITHHGMPSRMCSGNSFDLAIEIALRIRNLSEICYFLSILKFIEGNVLLGFIRNGGQTETGH